MEGKDRLISITFQCKIADICYLDLLQKFLPRPIKNDEDLLRVQTEINRLIDKPQSLTKDEKDFLDILGCIVADYERDIEI